MPRQTVDFDTFKQNFIDKPEGGYYPVCSNLAENNDGEKVKVMNIDLICEWRLMDGKVKFFEVPFENEDQFNEIVGFLKAGADFLHKAIHENIETLDYAEANGDPDGD